VFRLSLPNDFMRKATSAANPATLTRLISRPTTSEAAAA
jgi:hypothetical protein